MPSMFERTTKKLVKEIGDQQLRPVKCLVSATKIHRFSLIQRKKARSLFWQLPDIPLDISLMHILEPGSSVPDAAVEVPALFSDTEVRKQQVAASVNAGAEVGFSEETAAYQGSSLEYQIVSTPHETWTELQKRKLPDPEPAFLKQCREAGVNLYVVTDTVQLLKSTVLQDRSSANVLGKFSTPRNIWVKGEGQGRDLKTKDKKLTVPKDSVLAYKRKQLLFYSREWGILHIADREDQTFPTRETPRDCFCHLRMGHCIPVPLSNSKSGWTRVQNVEKMRVFRDRLLDDYSDDDDDDDDDDDEIFVAGSKEPPRDYSDDDDDDDDDDDEIFVAGSKEPPRDYSDDDDDDDDDDDEIFVAGSKEPPRDFDIAADDNQESFSEGSPGHSIYPIGECVCLVEECPHCTDFKLLQEEVSQNIKAAKLSKGTQGVVFSNLLAMLGDREALQDLLDTLELEPFGHLDGPGGTILTELRKDSRYPEVGSKCLLLYLLEALMVLSDIQHDLLAQSMEKRILLPQRDLVRSILEPNFNCFQNIPFTLQPKLLAPLQGEGLVVTYELLDECGLKMELNSPRSTWDPEAKEPLSALYGTLSVLRQLAEA